MKSHIRLRISLRMKSHIRLRIRLRMKSHIRFRSGNMEWKVMFYPHQNEKSYPIMYPVSEWKVISGYVSGIWMKSHIRLRIQVQNEKSYPVTDPHKKDQVLKLANRAPCVCCEIWYNLCFKGTVTWDKYLCHGEGGSFRQQTPFLIVLLQLPPSMFNQFLAIACGSHW